MELELPTNNGEELRKYILDKFSGSTETELRLQPKRITTEICYNDLKEIFEGECYIPTEEEIKLKSTIDSVFDVINMMQLEAGHNKFFNCEFGKDGLFFHYFKLSKYVFNKARKLNKKQ